MYHNELQFTTTYKNLHCYIYEHTKSTTLYHNIPQYKTMHQNALYKLQARTYFDIPKYTKIYKNIPKYTKNIPKYNISYKSSIININLLDPY